MKTFLANSCSCSQLSVTPKTWKRHNASVKKSWSIHYRFFDPLFLDKYPYGYQRQVRGMNEFKNLKDRQEVTQLLIDNELRLLKDCQYNPITGNFSEPPEEPPIDYIIDPQTKLLPALEKALTRLDIVEEFRKDIESNLHFIKPAVEQLRLDKMAIKDIKRRHIVMLLDQTGRNKNTWTASTYNRYRRNLSCIFRELVTIEAIEHNPIDEYLPTKKGTKKIKELLTDEEITLINLTLPAKNYNFWRFIHIFCNSGARTPELMKVKAKHVDLDKQIVKYTIKKGKSIREVIRPIKNDVLYLWEQLIIETAQFGSDSFLFSDDLEPGIKAIRNDQIKRRWRYWIQIKLGINKTQYSLKYLNTDKMDASYGSRIAARLNEHAEEMVTEHYAVNNKAREYEIIKRAPNSFAPIPVEPTGMG